MLQFRFVVHVIFLKNIVSNVSEPNFTPDIFHDLIKLIQNIPIIDNKLSHGNIDSRFYIENEKEQETARRLGIMEDDSISIRDLVKLFTKFLLDNRWNVLILEQRYTKLRELSVSYPIEYLLFDYCLCALGGNYTDARLYLAHSFHILGLSQSLHLLLGVIINDKLTKDIDVRKLLTALAMCSQPISASSHLEMFGNEYKERYEIYKKELRDLLRSKTD